jgi:ABC-2 type transport system permease protein
MKSRNMFVIAQKEVADHILDTGFLVLLATYTVILFASAYMAGSMMQHEGSTLLGGFGYITNIRMLSWFAPLIGIVLGFDALVREQKSGSLNVLLTHPVFRDNIIAGKLLGAMLVLAITIMFSVFVSVGTLLIFYGVEIGYVELIRIAVFTILTFFYASIFLGVGIIISTIAKNTTDSLIYNIIVWLSICVVFGAFIKTVVAILTGETSIEGGLITQLVNISPVHHYAEAAVGRVDLSFGGIGGTGSTIAGIFDTGYTLTQWLAEFWMNLVVLIITPIILLITAFIAFLRKDITR